MDSSLFLKETEDAKSVFAAFNSPKKVGEKAQETREKLRKVNGEKHHWFDFLHLRQRHVQKHI